jgi:hypothetical protein
MPCEVVLLSVDFFKMAAVAMETVILIIRNGAKTISLPNVVWET